MGATTNRIQTSPNLAELPEHLRQFSARTLAVDDSPRLTFPPDGAALESLAGGVPARVDRGQPPFTWFANGAPVALASYERETRLALAGPGFVTPAERKAQLAERAESYAWRLAER